MTSISFLTNYKFVLVSCKIFGFLNFHVSHLNYENSNYAYKIPENMPKTIRVYFGVLQHGSRSGTGLIGRDFGDLGACLRHHTLD